MDFCMPDFSLPGNSNQASQFVSNNGFNTPATTARLFVFSPRHIPDTCKRSQKYNFDLQFMNDVIESATEVCRNPTADVTNISLMPNMNSTVGAILPDATGTPIDNHRLCDYWTFVLQIDNDQPFDNVPGPRLTNRYIYSGFCSDEPVTSLDGVQYTANPNCILKITHSTGMSLQNRFSATGDYSKLLVHSDIDFIPPDILQTMSNRQLTNYLHPKDVAESITRDGSNMLILNGSASLAAKGNQVIPMASVMNHPKQHLKTIMSSVLATCEQSESNIVSSGDFQQNGTRNFPTDVGMIRTNLINNLPGSPGDALYHLDGSVPHSISDLQMRYPNLEIIPVSANKLTRNDLANQNVVTRSNIGSSVIVNAVPVTMNNVGLCEIAFFYRSAMPMSVISPALEEQGMFKIINAAPWMPEANDILQMRIKTFMGLMKTQVFPLIKHIGGEFDLSVSCNAAGECDCILTYLDDINGTQGIYESPLLLGGINTSMVGTDDILGHNVNNLCTLETALISELPSVVAFQPQIPTTLVNPLDSVTRANEEMAQQLFSA